MAGLFACSVRIGPEAELLRKRINKKRYVTSCSFFFFFFFFFYVSVSNSEGQQYDVIAPQEKR